jgi:hypothetical protein
MRRILTTGREPDRGWRLDQNQDDERRRQALPRSNTESAAATRKPFSLVRSRRSASPSCARHGSNGNLLNTVFPF